MVKTPLFTSCSLFLVIFKSNKVQTPHYFFHFWRIFASERLHVPRILGRGIAVDGIAYQPKNQPARWHRTLMLDIGTQRTEPSLYISCVPEGTPIPWVVPSTLSEAGRRPAVQG